MNGRRTSVRRQAANECTPVTGVSPLSGRYRGTLSSHFSWHAKAQEPDGLGLVTTTFSKQQVWYDRVCVVVVVVVVGCQEETFVFCATTTVVML